jgi:hypothetical protein
MPVSDAELRNAKEGVAMLVACLVQTIQQTDNTFQERFLDRLGLAYNEVRNNSEGDQRHAMEVLSWPRELLTGFNFVTGQGPPFLAGR